MEAVDHIWKPHSWPSIGFPTLFTNFLIKHTLRNFSIANVSLDWLTWVVSSQLSSSRLFKSLATSMGVVKRLVTLRFVGCAAQWKRWQTFSVKAYVLDFDFLGTLILRNLFSRGGFSAFWILDMKSSGVVYENVQFYWYFSRAKCVAHVHVT